ncbi:MAG: hypothetical protein AB1815_04965 [Bacillota bacterium]
MVFWAPVSMLLVFSAAVLSIAFITSLFRQGKTAGLYLLGALLLWGAAAGMIFIKPVIFGASVEGKTVLLTEEMLEVAPAAGLSRAETTNAPAQQEDLTKEGAQGGKQFAGVGADEDTRWGKITHPLGLTLRSSPAEGAAALAGLGIGKLVIMENDPPQGGWIKVTMAESGITGWVPGKYVAEIPRESRDNEAKAPGDKVGGVKDRAKTDNGS